MVILLVRIFGRLIWIGFGVYNVFDEVLTEKRGVSGWIRPVFVPELAL